MAAHRDHRKLSRYEIVVGMLVIGLAFPALAAANHRELPAAYTTISSISLVEVDEQAAAFEFANDLLTLNSAAPKARKRRLRRFRGFKVLNISRALPLGGEEVIVNLRSPGDKKSLMTVEFKF